MKKLLCKSLVFVLAALMLLGCMPFIASASVSGTTIKYSADADNEAWFIESDFIKVLQTDYPSATAADYWVRFDDTDDLNSRNGYLWKAKEYEDNEDRVKLQTGNVDDYLIGTSSNASFNFDYITFVPGTRIGEYSVNLTFRIYKSSTEYVDGKVTVNVSGDDADEGKFTYRVDKDDEVQFNADDFVAVFKASYSKYEPRYVTFESNNFIGNINGYVYYNYNKNNAVKFTAGTIDDYDYFISDSADGDYDVGKLWFVPGTRNGDYSISLNFKVIYGGSISRKGTLTISVNDKDTDYTVTYDVEHGDSVSLRADDFEDIFDEEYGNKTAEWVEFGTTDYLGSSYGYIYYNYGKSSEKQFTGSTIDNYEFILSDSSTSGYDLNKLSFVPGSKTGSYTVFIDFLVYSDVDHYVEGSLEITVSGGSTDGYKITYSIDEDETVDLVKSDFTAVAYKGISNKVPRYVQFDTTTYLSDSYGYLYYNYGDANKVKFTGTTIDDYKFYFSDSSFGTHPLSGLTFVPGSKTGYYEVKIDFTICYSDTTSVVEGTLYIEVSGDGSTGDIEYSVDGDDTLEFDANDFIDVYQSEKNETPRWVEFDTTSYLSTAYGFIYFDYKGDDEVKFTGSTIDDDAFYISSSTYGDYKLGKLTFVPGTKTGEYEVTLDFTVYYSNSKYVDGTLVITVDDEGNTTSGDVEYKTDHDTEISLDSDDFIDVFQDEYSTTTPRYIEFDSTTYLSSSYGFIYYDYDGDDEVKFTGSTIDDDTFYISSTSYGDYKFDDLTFVPGSKTGDYEVKIGFTVYYSATKKVDGELIISVGDDTATSTYAIVYNTVKGYPVSLISEDFSKFFKSEYPSSTLKYITLTGIPSTGTLYYNYSGDGVYGATKQTKLTSSTCDDNNFYVTPSSKTYYALDLLTYVPSTSSNYCTTIPFTAYYSSSVKVSGKILINVTNSGMDEVYYLTSKGVKTTFVATNFSSKVSAATGSTPSYIIFSDLPDAKTGTLYYNYTSSSSYSHKVNTTNKYMVSSTSGNSLSKVTFVPYSTYTGNVTIPYTAYTSAGTQIAAGEISIGVVSNVKTYGDVALTQWFYKYVTELSDKGIIDGMGDGTYNPDGKTTYGAALKLILLASGYTKQAESGTGITHWAENYMKLAKSKGIISADVNLDAEVSRETIAEIAAKALSLKTGTGYVSPFSDTENAYVIALYRAGIVEGDASASGARSFYPTTSISRAEIATIIWRIYQYKNS